MATTLAPSPVAVTFQRRRFTVEEFLRLAEVGILHEDDRVELIDGEIFEMAAIGIPHANAVADLSNLAVKLVGDVAELWAQNPILLGVRSEPQPDVALVRPQRPRNSHPAPADIFLVIEVADSSLDYDRTLKLPLYAAAGIAEAWLVDLRGRVVERHGEPRDGRYTAIQIAGRGETLASRTLPGFVLPVAAIFGAETETSGAGEAEETTE